MRMASAILLRPLLSLPNPNMVLQACMRNARSNSRVAGCIGAAAEGLIKKCTARTFRTFDAQAGAEPPSSDASRVTILA